MASLQEYEKALKALEIALTSPKTELNRDAAIQRFKFCIELAWKTAKKLMQTASSVPKTMIREMADQQMISNPEQWFSYIEARNLSSHTYKEDLAEKVYAVAGTFLPDGQSLLEKLKKI
ncbi:MAG: HI0074 family nucleotidyltransferase substrate-binding subunit [Bdellovibrionales bacterium]